VDGNTAAPLVSESVLLRLKLKNYKLPGTDQILEEMIQVGGE
jgi:hypothetical protein